MMVPVASTTKKLKLSGMVLLNCITSTCILDLATGLSKIWATLKEDGPKINSYNMPQNNQSTRKPYNQTI